MINSNVNPYDLRLYSTSPPQKPTNDTQTKYRSQIYILRSIIGPKVINTVIHIKNLLQLKGIYEEEIQEIILEENETVRQQKVLDQVSARQSESTTKEFPIIFIHNVPIGNVSDLEEWVISGKIDTLLEEVYTAEHQEVTRRRTTSFDIASVEERLADVQIQKELLQDEIQRAQQREDNDTSIMEELQHSILLLDKDYDALTKYLNSKRAQAIHSTSTTTPSRAITPYIPSTSGIMDWAVSGVSTAITSIGSVAGYLSSWKAHPNSNMNTSASSATNAEANKRLSTSPPKSHHMDEAANSVEFEVIQTNWYWRQQKRLLRLTNNKFSRVHPLTKEVRAVHKFSNIDNITITGKTFMTITFNDGSSPEYYQSVDLDRILKVILENTTIPVNYLEEEK